MRHCLQRPRRSYRNPRERQGEGQAKMRNATASGAGGDQVLRCTHPVPCRRCRSALEEWKNRLKDVAVVSKLAVRLYTYVGLGER